MKIWKKISHFLLGDFKNKLIALVLALIIWYSVSEEISAVRTIYDIPIQMSLPQNAPDYKNVELVWREPSQAQITVKGTKAKLDLISRNLSFRIVIPKGQRIGEKISLTLSENHLNLPPGVVCTNIEPKEVQYILSRFKRKRLPVRLNYQKKQQPTRYKIEYEPREVWVRGPEYLLNQLDELHTEVIDLHKDRAQKMPRNYPLKIPDKIKMAEKFKKDLLRGQEVQVSIKPKKKLFKMTLKLQVKVLISNKLKYRILIYTGHQERKLTFQGPEAQMKDLKNNPDKYIDFYIYPEKLELREMNPNTDAPMNVQSRINIDGAMKRDGIRLLSPLPGIDFWSYTPKDK